MFITASRYAGIRTRGSAIAPAGRAVRPGGIYGFALGYAHTGDAWQRALSPRLTHYFLNRLPEDFVCYWDLIFTAEDNQYRDTSAAAIAACGLAELLKLLPLTDPLRPAYGNAIELMMRNLRERCFAHAQDGLLREGVYNLAAIWALTNLTSGAITSISKPRFAFPASGHPTFANWSTP